MCDKCMRTTGILLAAMLTAPVTEMPEHTRSQVETFQDMRADVSRILTIISPSFDGKTEPDGDALAALMNDLSPAKLTQLTKMVGYLSSVLDQVNATCVAALQGFAGAGDVHAAIWLTSHREELGNAAGMIVLKQKESDDMFRAKGGLPDFRSHRNLN